MDEPLSALVNLVDPFEGERSNLSAYPEITRPITRDVERAALNDTGLRNSMTRRLGIDVEGW